MKRRYKAMLEEVMTANPVDDIISTLTSIATQKSNLQNSDNLEVDDDYETSDDSYKEKILIFLSKLEGYSTRIKELHWSAETMAMHKLCDDVRDAIVNYEDQIAEEFQGMINFRIKPGCLKPIICNASTLKELLSSLYADVNDLYDALDKGNNNRWFNGMCNVLDDMIHTINTFGYLSTFK